MATARPKARGSGGQAAGKPATGPDAVLAVRNRLITIMRGTTVNPYGDETNVGIPYLRHVQAALAEVSNQTFDPASQIRRTIREWTCIVAHWVDVDTDDTLLDEFTGNYFMIESIMEQPGVGMYPPAKVLTLRMRSGVSVTSDAQGGSGS